MSYMKKIPALVIALLLIQKIFSQGLSDTEIKIINWVKSNRITAEKLLEETVNINSGTFNIPGVKKTGEVFSRELQKAGLQTEWVTLPDSLKEQDTWLLPEKVIKEKRSLLSGIWIPFLNRICLLHPIPKSMTQQPQVRV